MKILIKNGLVHKFTGGKSGFEKNDVLIEDSRISKIEKCLQENNPDQVIDAKDCLVIPGLVNSHLHTYDVFYKGAFDNLPLELWILYLRPFLQGMKFTPDEIYLRTLFSCIEILKTGTTAVIDDIVQTPFNNQKDLAMIFSAYRKAGVRAYVSTHIADIAMYDSIPYLNELCDEQLKGEMDKGKKPPVKEILQYVETQVKTYNTQDSVQKYVLSVSGPQRNTIDYMRGIRALSEKYDLPVVNHILETKVQKTTGHIFYNQSLVEYLAANELLYENQLVIHSVWTNDKDIALMRKSKCNVVHNPTSNFKLGSGIAPLEKLLDIGLNVGLGTDNPSGNDNLNMFESIKMAALIHKVKHPNYRKWIGAQEAFKMATINGAKCACAESELGSLEAGKKADLTILDTFNERLLPANDYVYQLAFSENGSSVRDVIVNGKVVVKNKKITSFEEMDVLREIKERTEFILKERQEAIQEAKLIFDKIEKAYFLANNYQ